MSHKHIYFAPKNPDGTYGAIGRADYDDELHDKEIIMEEFIGKEIIPCKDCKYWEDGYCDDSLIEGLERKVSRFEDDFCSRGELK